MTKKISIIVGGSGQLGISLAKFLLKRNFYVVVTTRNITFAKRKIPIKNKNLKLVKLNVLKKKEIHLLLNKYKPKKVFYFAGQSSPLISFIKNKITYLSNAKGCENFLDIIYKKKIATKFINASSCEIFADSRKKINLNSKKRPISPYGKAKLISFNKTRFFREKKKLEAYNAILFNTESYFRDKSYLIPKICTAAIDAKFRQKKTFFGNLDVSREWNWSDEQITYMMKFLKKNPQDFILSNGKSYSARKMLSFAFGFFNLDYKLYVKTDKNLLRKKDFLIKKSDYQNCLKRNKIKRSSKIFGKRMIHKLIKYYINEKKN